jgi:tetratricopeptide (TPR) repeat protein
MEEELKRAKELAKTDPDLALRICNDVMNKDFDGRYGQMALFMSAYLMMEAERFGMAYHIYERCAQINPNISEIYSNMGMCLEEFDSGKAKRMFQKAYQLNPKNANAYANEGLLHLQTANPYKCIKLSRKALEIDPSLIAAKHNMGLAQVMVRDWKEGWKNYFDTLGVKHRERRDYGLPEWDGVSKGEVVIYGEQGVGDEIMFASCINDVLKTNDVILDCDGRLEGLFKRSFGCKVYGTRFKTETPLMDENKPQYQCAIGQLPYFYRQTDESFNGEPYLKTDPERSLQWRALFDTLKGKKIGVAWSGGLPNTGSKKRTLALDDLEPLFNDEDTFISLEYKDVSQVDLDRYNLKSYPRATAKGGDIDDLAALIGELDVVVTACTTVVYVAGALGVPCIVMVPREAGYRYHDKGCFPWYSSVKLIRQTNSWKKTVVRANEEARRCLKSL